MTTLVNSYATADDVYRHVPRVGSLTTVTTSDIGNFIGKAEAEINAKLSQIYDLPFTVAIPVLTHMATDMGAYYTLRSLYSEQQMSSSEWVDRFKEARELLDKLAEGTVSLVDSGGDVVGTITSGRRISTGVEGYKPAFDMTAWIAQTIDGDRIDDEGDERD